MNTIFMQCQNLSIRDNLHEMSKPVFFFFFFFFSFVSGGGGGGGGGGGRGGGRGGYEEKSRLLNFLPTEQSFKIGTSILL